MAETTQMVEVNLILHRRPDGGIRVRSTTLPGLILSGADDVETLECIGPAIKTLLEHAGDWPAVPSEAAEAAYLATLPSLTDLG